MQVQSGIAAALLLSWIMLACKTPQPLPTSHPLTDETKAAITRRCDQGLEAEGTRASRLRAVCDCFKSRGGAVAKLAASYCHGDANAYFDQIAAVGKAEGKLVLTDSAGNSPDAKAAACAGELVEMRVEKQLGRILDACNDNDKQLMLSFLRIPQAASAGQCWRFVRMTADGCVEAMPCTGKGSAILAALPLTDAARATWTGLDPVPEGTALRLCHAKIQAMHQLKDPKAAAVRYNYPFASFLSLGGSNAKVTYGAANCHGAAQAIAGSFLDQVEVSKLEYRGELIAAACGALAEAVFARAKESPRGFPTGADLPIAKGGHIVNMDHDPSCSADDCGVVSFNTFACGGGELESHIFHQNMCINCWGKRLEQVGLKLLPESSSWKDLTPGCVLTQNDHSVTTVFQNDGFCYFYESLSPFASPQLNVAECPMLFSAFPRRWCPSEPLAFEIMQ